MSNERRGIGQHPTVELQSNWLTVNRRLLRADVLDYPGTDRLAVTPEELRRVILLGRDTILRESEEFYHEQVFKQKRHDVERPSIWTAQFGTTDQTDGPSRLVFTERGYANGGINQNAYETQPAFLEYWWAVADAGFIPEVRRTSTRDNGGAWLSLRKPTVKEVLTHWFYVPDGYIDYAAELAKDDDKDAENLKFRKIRMIGERAVELAPSMYDAENQAKLMLSMAAIKLVLGNHDGYRNELEDAIKYVQLSAEIDSSTLRAIENSAFELDW